MVLLKNTVSQMVYKHAISTVVPSRVVRLPLQNPPEDEDEQSELYAEDACGASRHIRILPR